MKAAHNFEGLIRPVAEESLSTFDEVASAARSEKLRDASHGPSSFASMNTFTSTNAVSNSHKINQANSDGYELLMREPAIARVVVADENGKRSTYFFSRATPMHLPKEGRAFASYRSPLGRLAELSVGDEHAIRRNGEEVWVELVEHAVFHPLLANDHWDAHNIILQGEGYGPLSLDSFRALLTSHGEIDDSLLDELLREESAGDYIREGVRRGVLSKMDLRDQPTLDRYQGEIFRLPLDSRLLILGAPGTGKTTTLIRRLGQKLDTDFLEEAERRMVLNLAEVDHTRSWIMFTPTELLRLYVKEAFNREGIAAPDERIRTWDDFRDDLARNEFRVLRSAASTSALVMKPSAATLLEGTDQQQIAWFSDFDTWQKTVFWQEMRDAAQNLSENSASNVANLGARIVAVLDTADPNRQMGSFARLIDAASDITALADEMKQATDAKILGALNLQVNRDRNFLNEMAEFITSLGDLSDDPDEPEAEDEDEASQPRVGRAAALAAYMRAVRAQARAVARKRSVAKSSTNAKLLEWLGDRTLPEADLLPLGESLTIQGQLRAFTNPARRYVDGTLARYRRYRRARQTEGRWFKADGFSATDIHPLEVDIILLAMMRASNDLITGVRSTTIRTSAARPTLERMEALHQTQVLVDEATDFSPIQLACMAALARPGIRSFFACGDFNQRVTSWGTRTVEEMQWVVPEIATRTVTVAYRQSQKLHEFARRLVDRTDTGDATLPDFADDEGVSPVFATGMADLASTAIWLANRIKEIEKSVDMLPTIAVLVNSEDAVRPVALALGNALIEENITVEPCPDGKVKGRDGTVRVFNVQHIKGLEFEAVFFVGIDDLAQSQPDLFDKYLYVGATRAATYLGLICTNSLPKELSGLEQNFIERWL